MKRGTEMKQYVIIGNGIAAAACIEGIRKADKMTPIVVVSREKHPVYCRPLISYYLEGKTDLQKINYRSPSFYDDNGCTVKYGVSAEKINSENKTVTLSDGETIPYSAVCVATGSDPFVPPIDGLEAVKNRFSFLTLDDALSLEKAVTPDSKVLIIGAGLIGLKCAEGISGKVKSITVCDLSERILSSILDSDSAPIVRKHIEKNGISFLMGDSVVSVDGNRAVMKSGKTVTFDILVTAVGVRPNTALVSDAGGKVNRGILVDESMKTSIDCVYAAGDCTEGYDITLGGQRVLALLPNAYIQGLTAGSNMAGGNAVFDKAVPMNSIGFFGLHIMTAGTYVAEKDGGTVYTDSTEESYRKFFVKDGVLKGYILVNGIERGGIYTSLIREKTPLESIDFDLLMKNPTFMAFSRETRGKKFGGVV